MFVLQGAVIEAVHPEQQEWHHQVPSPKPHWQSFELCEHLCFISIYFAHSLARCVPGWLLLHYMPFQLRKVFKGTLYFPVVGGTCLYSVLLLAAIYFDRRTSCSTSISTDHGKPGAPGCYSDLAAHFSNYIHISSGTEVPPPGFCYAGFLSSHWYKGACPPQPCGQRMTTAGFSAMLVSSLWAHFFSSWQIVIL